MTPAQFCYWLQGAIEVSEMVDMTEAQLTTVRNHLSLVFTHVLDKEHDGGDPDKAELLNATHSPGKKVTYRC